MGNLIGVSLRMQRLYPLILRAASHRYSVLIVGERGTGKKLVARSIHSLGSRADKPFVLVDCLAIAPTFVEAELFGYARDAFINAAEGREGLLSAAGGGTVFLDEIAEMPLKLQGKMFRLLQEGKFSPIGSTEQRTFQARVLAATRRNLGEFVERGTFREDLYFRLNVVQIALPPLRERRPDIPLLANYFLEKYSDPRGPARSISDATMERLLAYAWPGNVREMEDAVRWALSLAASAVVEMDDLPPVIRNAASRKSQEQAEPISAMPSEYVAIIKVLEATGGNRAAAAHLLRMGEATLANKLKGYDL